MTPEQFLNLKVGDKLRKVGRTDAVYTVVNNDPPGNILMIPGRFTRVGYRPVHPETWEFDPDQIDDLVPLWVQLAAALEEIKQLEKLRDTMALQVKLYEFLLQSLDAPKVP
jgi:hypothetical protein